MSAIARYFLHKGLFVAGYDKTPSTLTRQLEKEGMTIHYEENVNLIPIECCQPETTLVVYTPAIPATHAELVYSRNNGFTIEKTCASPWNTTVLTKDYVSQEHMVKQRRLQCVHIFYIKAI